MQTNAEGFSLSAFICVHPRPILDRGISQCSFWICDACSINNSERRERVRLGAVARRNVQHSDAANRKRICHQHAMTAKWIAFGAHDRHRFFLAQRNQLFDSLPKFGRLHVIRETAKACVLPADIDRILARMTQSAERF